MGCLVTVPHVHSHCFIYNAPTTHLGVPNIHDTGKYVYSYVCTCVCCHSTYNDAVACTMGQSYLLLLLLSVTEGMQD